MAPNTRGRTERNTGYQDDDLETTMSAAARYNSCNATILAFASFRKNDVAFAESGSQVLPFSA